VWFPSKCSLPQLLDAFSLEQRGTREKALQKENAEKRVSLSAESDKGYAPLTAVAFWKKRRKNFPPNLAM